jgi:hypothetical protein
VDLIEEILTGKVAIPNYLNIYNFWSFLDVLREDIHPK